MRLWRWCESWNVAQNFVDGTHDVFDTDLGFHEISVSPELFAAGSLVF